MADVTKVVYINDKGNEGLNYTDDSWKYQCAFSEEPDGYYYEYTMTYDPLVPLDYYLNMGRRTFALELEERGLNAIDDRTQRRETRLYS